MFKPSKTKLIKDLHSTLEEERRLLSIGSLSELTPLSIKKSNLVETLSSRVDLAKGDLDDLKPLMDHNQKLLTAAVRAVRRVSGRRTKTAPLKNAYETYSPDGDRHRIGDSRRSTFERRS